MYRLKFKLNPSCPPIILSDLIIEGCRMKNTYVTLPCIVEGSSEWCGAQTRVELTPGVALVCGTHRWLSYVALVCGTHMWHLYVALVCYTRRWLLYVALVCGTFMWHLYVTLICGFSMWYLYVVLIWDTRWWL